MSRRFWTADWHLGLDAILHLENRPFKTIQEHDRTIVMNACEKTMPDDTIIHLGDLACFKQDLCMNSLGLVVNPMQIVNKIPAQFINIRGNHDVNNRVKSICESMHVHLGKKFPDVICGHYPSYDRRAEKYLKDGWIILCGHVHGKWKHCLDLDHSCLNINCGVDVWKYNVISDEELSKYIEHVLHLPKEKITTVKTTNGKLVYGNQES